MLQTWLSSDENCLKSIISCLKLCAILRSTPDWLVRLTSCNVVVGGGF